METKIENGIWVAWESHRRNKSLSSSLGVPLYELDYRLPRLMRYLCLPWVTLALFLRKNPRIIFVQNPSLVLALTAIIFGRLTSRIVVVDAHNAGLLPLEGENAFLNALARHLMRRATLTIVSNQGLADQVRRAGGQPCILPDPLPRFDIATYQRRTPDNEIPNVLFVCTWAKDEPYVQVFKAARLIKRPISILVTGNYARAPKDVLQHVPNNVKLLGYVTEKRYQELLMRSDVILDLTMRENCLVCGAYEAVAAKKPLITSCTKALRTYFHKGAVYTRSEPEAIAHAILDGLDRQETLVRESEDLRRQLRDDFDAKKRALLKAINRHET